MIIWAKLAKLSKPLPRLMLCNAFLFTRVCVTIWHRIRCPQVHLCSFTSVLFEVLPLATTQTNLDQAQTGSGRILRHNISTEARSWWVSVDHCQGVTWILFSVPSHWKQKSDVNVSVWGVKFTNTCTNSPSPYLKSLQNKSLMLVLFIHFFPNDMLFSI